MTLVAAFFGNAFGWNASGTVKDASGKALSGVSISIKDSTDLKATTDASGAFLLASPTTGIKGTVGAAEFSMRIEGNDIVLHHPAYGELDLSILDPNGASRWETRAALNHGTARVAIPAGGKFATGILRVRHAGQILSQQPVLQGGSGLQTASPRILARAEAVFPTLSFSKPGYRDTTYAMKSAAETGIAMTMRDTVSGGIVADFVEDHRSSCKIPVMSAVSALTTNALLPDPFKMMDGTPVTTKAQWTCRREEIAAMLEAYVHGEKPRNPEKVTGSMSGSTLTVSVTDKGKTVKFNVTITKPTSGTAPFAAVIGYGGGNISGYSSLPVASINYTPFNLASEGSGRGKGVFYDLYGSSASASELMAQAWGVSRIIDALAVTPAAGIDPKRIAVTGCSRYGKGAIVAGAFDQRIKLVIPQESGSGGVSAWRIIATLSDAQPIAATANEAYWTRADFLANFGTAPGKLPIDHHELDAMVAPNGLLVLDNSIGWLGPKGGYGASIAAKEVFTALGADQAITYSSVGGHTHCSQPATQDHWVESYVKKFLLGQTGEAAKIESPSDYAFDKAKWINWTTPILK